MIEVINTELEEVKIIKPKLFYDDRGYFFESYNEREVSNQIGNIAFVQDNESKSSFGVLRGMHYQQKPYEQCKLIRVIEGKIQDIVIDLRKDSSSYLKHVSVILDEVEKKQLFIPKGFAHGFLVLSKYAIVSYKVDNFYSPKNEISIPYNNPKLGLNWNLSEQDIKVSEKDKVLTSNFKF